MDLWPLDIYFVLDLSFLTYKRMILGTGCIADLNNFVHFLWLYMRNGTGGNVCHFFSVLIWHGLEFFGFHMTVTTKSFCFFTGDHNSELCVYLCTPLPWRRGRYRIEILGRETRRAFVKWLENNCRKNLISFGVIRNHLFCNLAVKWSLEECDVSKLREFPYVRIFGSFR